MRSICLIVLCLISIPSGSSQMFWGYPLPKQQTIVLPEILQEIGLKESNNNWEAVNLNRNGTRDWGRFQMNDIAFEELLIKKGMPIPNRQEFLCDSLMQSKYALVLLNHNDSIMKRRGKKVNRNNQLKAWAKSAYNI